MLAPPYNTAVIGRTGRGDYGHGLGLAVLNQPKLKVVAVADDDARVVRRRRGAWGSRGPMTITGRCSRVRSRGLSWSRRGGLMGTRT